MIWCYDTPRIVDFVRGQIEHRPDFGDCAAIGLEDETGLYCGVLYNEYRKPEGDIRMHIAASSPKWCLPGRIRGFFAYPFGQLNCERVTAVVSAGHPTAHDLNKFLGFQYEGTIRRGFPGGVDAVLYGMLKHECRWLKPITKD